MMSRSVMPAVTASSTTYWIAGLSRTGSISFGCAFVAGRNRVPRPAAGITALRTLVMSPLLIGRLAPAAGEAYPRPPGHSHPPGGPHVLVYTRRTDAHLRVR